MIPTLVLASQADQLAFAMVAPLPLDTIAKGMETKFLLRHGPLGL